MREHVVELLLQAAQESGALALRDLWREVALLAGDREFTSAEVVAHASLPENHRLRAALDAACGADYGAAKVGKIFAKWADVDVAGIAIVAIGEEANAIVWRAKVNPARTAGTDADKIIALPIAKERHAC